MRNNHSILIIVFPLKNFKIKKNFNLIRNFIQKRKKLKLTDNNHKYKLKIKTYESKNNWCYCIIGDNA